MSNPFTVPISRAPQNAIPDQYLVRLKEHSDLASHLNWLQGQMPQSNDGESPKFEVIHKYNLIKGYAAKLPGPVLENLANRDDVKSITEDRRPTL
ncbi:hypothetical protein FRC08_005815 [Ceratobasidium sp. 394]|nr:hypothetical protein FRC08_005815 [Ceratobasidium sp. 394]KAG9094364.1 hypothetical protein FS749_012615 [Ceratobasidium sp. UAMH 11750]